MKKIFCIILALAITFMFCSCTSKKQIETPVCYYYRTAKTDYGTQSGVIYAEIRESKGHTNDYVYLIEQYLNGPKTYDCISPFPAGTTLEEFNLDNNKAQLILSPHLAVISGSELMIACACLAKTVLELTGVTSVQISSVNSLLNNAESITLTSDSFVYWDAG